MFGSGLFSFRGARVSVLPTRPALAITKARSDVQVRSGERVAVRTMRFPRIYGRRPDSAKGVHRLRDRFEVGGVHAGAIPAEVIEFEPWRCGANEDRVGERVCFAMLSVVGRLSIAARI